jgi:transglutaminase-like putative cysteine protease
MKAVPRFVYLLCFIGLGIVAALALNRVVQPSMATILVRTVFMAAICAAPGLIYRKLWPLALVLLPVGCYLLIRTIMPVPTLVEGFVEQFRFYTEQLAAGASAYKTAVFPLDLMGSPELQLLLAFAVYWLMGAAAFLALSLRRPAPAVVLVLILLGYSLTVDSESRVLWPALLFVVLTACLFVLSRGVVRAGWRLRDVVAGGLVGAVASALAFALLLTAPSVAADPWRDWRAWDPFNRGGSIYSFNWLQNYPRLLNPGNNVVIMSVESPSPSYWRANALDSFTGTAWVTSQAFLQQIEGVPLGEPDANGRYAAYVYDIPASGSPPEGRGVTQTFRIQAVYTNYFFAGGDPQSLVIDLAIPLRMNDMRALRVSTALGPALAYSLDVIVPEVAPTDLVGLGSDYPEYVDDYLTLPFARAADIEGPDEEAAWRSRMEEAGPDGWEWMDLYALNESIVRDATDPYQITLRIERYLRQFYTYSLTPPPSEYSSPYSAFLFDGRSGYCQHFAGAMALLLRYNGIPSRVAVGFTSGEAQADGTYLVSTNNAHAWVEVYFPTVGWVAFDPTPGRSIPYAGASSTSPEFVNPFVDTSTPSGGTTPTLPPQDTMPGSQLNGGGTPESGGAGWLSRATWLPWVAAIILVIVGYPIIRSLWRRRRLRSGSLEGRLEASLGLLRADLSDHGVPVSRSHTLDDTLSVVYAHLDIDPDQAFVERTDAILFGGRHARAADVERAEALRHLVRTRLRTRRGWLRRVMAWYGVSRFPRRSELQYRDDKTGRKTKEAARIHPRAL